MSKIKESEKSCSRMWIAKEHKDDELTFVHCGRCNKKIEEYDSRDRFATAALTGLLASPSTSTEATAEGLSEVSYLYADAMMKERARVRPEITKIEKEDK